MSDDDYLAIIGELVAQLRAANAGDVANERNYLVTDQETGDAVLMPPKQRVLQMLAAFERALAIQDRATYDKAMAVMGRVLKGQGPEHIELRLAGDRADAGRTFDFSDAPDLRKVRGSVKRLIGALADTDRSPDSERTN